MKAPTHSLGQAADGDLQVLSPPRAPPSAGEVVGAIGWLLAVHLAVAFGVTLSLRLAGIA